MSDEADLKRAKEIVRNGLDMLDKRSTKATSFGELWFFEDEEYKEIDTLNKMVGDYIQTQDSPRPLCIAIFGPPGSGKSFAVKQIFEKIRKQFLNKHFLSITEVNLTQMESTQDLVTALKRVAVDIQSKSETGINTIPFVFFDEFDAPLAGVPLGWLNWFLSPMHDGMIGHGEKLFPLKRAVYWFAGGTSSSLEDFSNSGSREFRDAKGPDFISRLRGYLNVRGPNDTQSTASRRAIIIRSTLDSLQKKHPDKKAPKLSTELLEALFNQGRFKHGARSISALLEMTIASAAINSGQSDVDLKDLPPPHIQSVHADQGPLDPDIIGGLVGISIGSNSQQEETSNAAITTKEIAIRLWQHGATLAYGGKFGRELTEALLRASRSLGKTTEGEEVRVEVFAREDRPKDKIPSSVKVVPTVTYLFLPEDLPDAERARECIVAFRMRWLSACRSVARTLIGGKEANYSGRMPGILEEAALALALNQPLYIVGTYGGAARMLGEILGLATGISSSVIHTLKEVNDADLDPRLRRIFQPHGLSYLPFTYSDAIAFISGYAIGGPLWPDNGLSIDDNRRLFEAKESTRIADLILKGMLRRFSS